MMTKKSWDECVFHFQCSRHSITKDRQDRHVCPCNGGSRERVEEIGIEKITTTKCHPKALYKINVIFSMNRG